MVANPLYPVYAGTTHMCVAAPNGVLGYARTEIEAEALVRVVCPGVPLYAGLCRRTDISRDGVTVERALAPGVPYWFVYVMED